LLVMRRILCVCVFFFQAEDGIRDRNVTGVQPCALPISFFFQCLLLLERFMFSRLFFFRNWHKAKDSLQLYPSQLYPLTILNLTRSEERRVGKDGRMSQMSVANQETE